jgi:hypothetical protein
MFNSKECVHSSLETPAEVFESLLAEWEEAAVCPSVFKKYISGLMVHFGLSAPDVVKEHYRKRYYQALHRQEVKRSKRNKVGQHDNAHA